MSLEPASVRNEGGELFGECNGRDCLAVEADLGCDGLGEDDYVFYVHSFSQIIVHDGDADTSEMITAAAGLVLPCCASRPSIFTVWVSGGCLPPL